MTAIATPTEVLNEVVSADGTSFVTTLTVTPTVGRGYFVWVGLQRGNTVTDGTLTHPGLTLTKVATANITGGTPSFFRLVLWKAVAAGTTGGSFTYDCAGVTHTSCSFSVSEIASGFNATTPVPQGGGLVSENDTDGDITASLGSAFVNANSITMSAVMHPGGTAAFTVPTGWTSLHAISHSSPNARVQVAYIMGNDADADWTSTIASGEDLGAIIAEIAENPVPVTGTPDRSFPRGLNRGLR